MKDDELQRQQRETLKDRADEMRAAREWARDNDPAYWDERDKYEDARNEYMHEGGRK